MWNKAEESRITRMSRIWNLSFIILTYDSYYLLAVAYYNYIKILIISNIEIRNMSLHETAVKWEKRNHQKKREYNINNNN